MGNDIVRGHGWEQRRGCLQRSESPNVVGEARCAEGSEARTASEAVVYRDASGARVISFEVRSRDAVEIDDRRTDCGQVRVRAAAALRISGRDPSTDLASSAGMNESVRHAAPPTDPALIDGLVSRCGGSQPEARVPCSAYALDHHHCRARRPAPGWLRLLPARSLTTQRQYQGAALGCGARRVQRSRLSPALLSARVGHC